MRGYAAWWILCFGFFFGWCSVQFAAGWKLEIALVDPPSELELIIQGALIDEMFSYPTDHGYDDEYYPDEEIEIHCLQEAIYYEAGNQRRVGKRAVAEVIRNRVISARFPDTYCEVVSQPNQFSFTLFENDYNLDRRAWQDSGDISVDVFYKDDTELDAMWYHADYISTPGWATRLNRVSHIGQHIFYEEL